MSSDRMADAAPAWAYEKAAVYPHDARWADLGRVEQEQLVELLKPWLVDGGEQMAFRDAKAHFVAQVLRRTSG